ncbi:unnamed protein product, partial [Iphiclides podalirius]
MNTKCGTFKFTAVTVSTPPRERAMTMAGEELRHCSAAPKHGRLGDNAALARCQCRPRASLLNQRARIDLPPVWSARVAATFATINTTVFRRIT